MRGFKDNRDNFLIAIFLGAAERMSCWTSSWQAKKHAAEQANEQTAKQANEQTAEQANEQADEQAKNIENADSQTS